MSRSYKLFSLLLIALVLGSASCKKEGPDTPYTRIQGKWKLAKTATDDNDNGNIDNTEITPVPVPMDDEITFNKDYTGIENSTYNGAQSLPLDFNWAFVNDSVQLTYEDHNTITYYLISVSSSSLVLQANTKYGLAWYTYDKR